MYLLLKICVWFKYILFLAKHSYVSFIYAIKYLYICHTLVILHLNRTLIILLMTLFRSKRINNKTSETTFLTFNPLTKLSWEKPWAALTFLLLRNPIFWFTPFATQSVRLSLSTYLPLCSTCMTCRIPCHSIGHQVVQWRKSMKIIYFMKYQAYDLTL